MSAPQTVLELIEHFERNLDDFKSGRFSEEHLRLQFLNPLFGRDGLGWDIYNDSRYAEAYKDVIHEDALRIGEGTKAPDYCFRIGGTRKFFLEAKKPSVDIKDDVAPAYQLRRYAWTAKLPLSVLSDFEEFAIYDCRIKPRPSDKASAARIFYCTFRELPEKWDYIASIFSRDAVLKGSFDKFAAENKARRGTAEVDADFLEEIERWRKELAQNLALRNPRLTQRELNFAIQRIIDRIIFLRIAEDRGLENYGKLLALTNGPRIYPRLCELFEAADARYNSGLFHFKRERDRHEAPDELTLRLDIDDRLLKDILKNLYYPDSPYAFSVLSADILGQVYEQFLGKVITLTEGHRAKVEDKPEVKKAGGVYYTPTYIVDYIVRETVGKLLEGIVGANGSGAESPGAVSAEPEGRAALSPARRGEAVSMPARLSDSRRGEDTAALPLRTPAALNLTQPSPQAAAAVLQRVAKLRIVDPACGSGSFLIGAYQFLLDWHLAFYTANDPARWAKEVTRARRGGGVKLKAARHPVLVQTRAGGWQLSIAERKRILLDNIHGVDIDAQAVEVTKLSLLLKVLEGDVSLAQLSFGLEDRVLPDLGDNIKCGNSLIGPDFYAQPDLPVLTDEERFRINVFDWRTEFAEVFKAGGFDAVIGNPPWGAEFSESELEYLRESYARVIARMVDSYIYFIDRACHIARKNAPIGLIIPSTVLNQTDAQPVRKLLLDRGLTNLVSLGEGIFGRKVLNTSTIFVSTAVNSQHRVADLTRIPLPQRHLNLLNIPSVAWAEWHAQVTSDPHTTFFTGRVGETSLFHKLRAKHQPLSAIVNGAIQRGVSPDVAAAHVVAKAEAKKLLLEPGVLRASVSGPQIKRYRDWKSDQFIIYTSRETPIKGFPNALKYLEKFRDRNTCSEVRDGKHPWWALHRPRDPMIFASPKFIGLTTSKTIELVFDPDSSVFVTDAMYVFQTVPGIDPHVLMATLQSRLFLFLYRVSNQGESRVIPQVKASKLDALPVPNLDPSNKDIPKLRDLATRMYSLHRQRADARTPQEQTNLDREIKATDAQIDRLVYELYGLTEEEIRIVEGAPASVSGEPADSAAAPAAPLPQGQSTPQSEGDAAHYYYFKEPPPKYS